MTAVAGPYLIVCSILGLGGVAKLVSPHAAQRAVHALGIPGSVSAVRALGVGEVALACAAVSIGGTALPLLVGAAYLTFAGFVVAMLRTEQATSCGCFGSRSTPPSWLHVAVNVGSAAVAFAATGMPNLLDTLADQPWGGLPLVGLASVGTYLLFLLLTALPVLFAPPLPRVEEFSLIDRPAR